MSRAFPILMLVFALAGALLGWNSVPHYRPPAASGETRLRERAAQYYKATRLFESLKMSQLYTPAKQLAEQADLLQKSEKFLATFAALEESNQSNLRTAADSITPGSLELELEGGWATTWGSCVYPTENSQVTIKLDTMVWVRSGGDWWIYTWTKPEIAAYGNPPDASYELLKKRKMEELQRLAREYEQSQRLAEQQQAPPLDADSTAPGDGSQPAENGGDAGGNE